MAITLRGFFSGTSTAGTGTIALSYSGWTTANPVAGDLLACVVRASGSAAQTITQTAGTGTWTIPSNDFNSSSLYTSAPAWRVMGASDTAPTFTYSGGAAIYQYAIAAFIPDSSWPVNPVDAEAAVLVNASAVLGSTGWTPNSASASGSNDLSVVMGNITRNSSGAGTPAEVAPSGWTACGAGALGGASARPMAEAALFYKTPVGSGSVAPGVMTGSPTGDSFYAEIYHFLFTEVTAAAVSAPLLPYTGGQAYRRRKARQRQLMFPPGPVLVSSSDSGTGTDSGGQVNASVSSSDSATGTDSQSVLAQVSSSDSGAGTDLGVQVGVSATDSGTGTDSGGQVNASVSSSDSGTGTDSSALYLFQSDSGSGADAGSVLARISSSDSGTGTDSNGPPVLFQADSGTGTDGTGSVLAQVSSSDSGTGTDAQALRLFQSDSAAGTDAGSVLAEVSSSDSGTGTETQGVGVSSSDSGAGADTGTTGSTTPSSSDSATGTDTGVQVGVSSSDSAAGTDSGFLQPVQVSSSDTGTGTDTGVRVGISSSDTGTGSDGTGQVSATVSSADSGTGSDLGAPVGVASLDSGTGTDSSGAVLARISSSDSGTGTDSNGPPVLFQPDAGSGTDSGSVLAQVSSSDSGTGTDLSGAIGVSSSDSATGTDAGFSPQGNVNIYDSDYGIAREGDIEYPPDGAYIQPPATDSATGTEAQSLLAQVAGSDSGTGLEAQSVFYLVQAVSDSDFAIGTELWSVFAHKADSDSATGIDAQVLLYAPSGSDSATGTDQAAPVLVYSWLPYGLFFEGFRGGIRVVWRPGTAAERELLRVPDAAPSRWLIEFAETIRLADSLMDVSDSDSATGSESAKPTATVVQFATSPQVTGGVR